MTRRSKKRDFSLPDNVDKQLIAHGHSQRGSNLIFIVLPLLIVTQCHKLPSPIRIGQTHAQK